VVAVEGDCVGVIFWLWGFYGFSKDPWLLAETLEKNERVVDCEIVLLDLEGVVWVE
jgi:hypothetical protein